MNKIVFAVALVLLSSAALAKSSKGTPPPAQNHSCMLNAAVVEKTKKECLKAGGKWEKNSPAATTAPVVAPATPVAPSVPAVEPKPIETPTK
ncbi:hypothetical protein BCS42_03020 [Crenothrix sp. D3]|nr:hypothetical protein BCS42_03020 [Crenothrix sp. D3]